MDRLTALKSWRLAITRQLHKYICSISDLKQYILSIEEDPRPVTRSIAAKLHSWRMQLGTLEVRKILLTAQRNLIDEETTMEKNRCIELGMVVDTL